MISRSKYNARKCVVDGQVFDSVKEARRYCELALLQRVGEISDLRRQVKYVLIPAQYEEVDGKKKLIEREVSYKADFVYTENGIEVVEDVKGFRTKEYVLKRKMMLFLRGIRVREV